jgi:ADP-heptose:LPS heptosyltransferase
MIPYDNVGVMHVANALQNPLLAFYGPTDYMRTAPLSTNSHLLHSRNECWAKMYNFK